MSDHSFVQSGLSDRDSDQRAGIVPDGSENAPDYAKLQEDIANLRDAVTRLTANAKSEAGKAAQHMASQMGDAASNAASKAKTFASEIENAARQNPLGALAGALAVGVLIGLVGRGRG